MVQPGEDEAVRAVDGGMGGLLVPDDVGPVGREHRGVEPPERRGRHPEDREVVPRRRCVCRRTRGQGSSRSCAAPVRPSLGWIPHGLRVVMNIGSEQERPEAPVIPPGRRSSAPIGRRRRPSARIGGGRRGAEVWRTASENFSGRVYQDGPHPLLSPVGPSRGPRRRTVPFRGGVVRASGPEGVAAPGRAGAVHGTRSRTRGPATPDQAPQGVLRVRRGRCAVRAPGGDGRGRRRPPGRRGSGGAVGARRRGRPRVGSAPGRRGRRTGARARRRGGCRRGLDRLGRHRAARAQLLAGGACGIRHHVGDDGRRLGAGDLLDRCPPASGPGRSSTPCPRSA